MRLIPVSATGVGCSAVFMAFLSLYSFELSHISARPSSPGLTRRSLGSKRPTRRKGGPMSIRNYRGLDLGLGETADAIRDTVQSFAVNEIVPLAEAIDRSDEFPRQLWPKLGELGLLGITVEEDYGGAGLGYVEHCV